MREWINRDVQSVATYLAGLTNRVRTLRLDEEAMSHTPSQGKVIANAAIWNDHAAIEETKRDYLIPRQSLTAKLFLQHFSPIMQFADVPFRHLDKASRDALAKIAKTVKRYHPTNRQRIADKLMTELNLTFISGTNPRLVWKSDETLLVKRKGFDKFDAIAFKRVTHYTKEMSIQKETTDLPIWTEADEKP